MKDFQFFYDAAERLSHHEVLYQHSANGHTYVYSPFLALCLIPLTCLSIGAAFKVWTAINIFFVFVAVATYCAAAKIGLRDAPSLVLLLLTTFRFWPMEMNFAFGQANSILLMILCAIYLLEQKQKSPVSAVLIALAALIKTWMIGLVLYFLIKRDWQSAMISIALVVSVAGALFGLVGPEEFKTFLSLTANYVALNGGGPAPSQSILGFARLHFVPNIYVDPLIASQLGYGIFACVGIGVVCLTLLYMYRLNLATSLHPLQNRLVLGIVMSSLLLCSPVTETYYFVLCLPLIWTLLVPASQAEAPCPHTLPGYLRLGTLVVYLLFTKSWPTYIIVPDEFKHGLKSLLVTAEFYWSFALWLLAVAALCLSHTRWASEQITADSDCCAALDSPKRSEPRS